MTTILAIAFAIALTSAVRCRIRMRAALKHMADVLEYINEAIADIEFADRQGIADDGES